MGCCESCNPNYKSLSGPNGTNLLEQHKVGWVKRTFSKVQVSITLEFEIVKTDGKSKVQTFANELVH